MTHRNRITIVCLIVLFGALAWLQSHLRISSDLRQFLPAHSAAAMDTPPWMALLQRGEQAGLVLIAIDAGSREANIRISRELRQRLQASGAFARVNNGEANLLTVLADLAPLFTARYLLAPDLPASAFTAEGLRRTLERRLDELRAGLGPWLKQTLAADPHNAFIAYLRQINAGQDPDKPGVWVGRSQSRALLAVQLKGPIISPDVQQAGVAQIRELLSQVSKTQHFVWELSGPAVFAADARAAIESTTRQVCLIAGIVLLGLFVWIYRSPQWLLLALLPLGSAVITGLTVTQAVFGQVHGITLAYGITVLGVCVDYPVHLFSHLQPEQAGFQAMQQIGKTLRLGALTTAAAYLAMLGTGFPGLDQMALFAASGILAAALVTRTVVAAWARGRTPPVGLARVDQIPQLLYQTRRFVMPLVVVLLVGLFAMSKPASIWARDITAMSPVPESSRARFASLARDTGFAFSSHVFIWTGADPDRLMQDGEILDRALESLAAEQVVSGFASPSRMLPSRQTQDQRRARLPTAGQLRKALAQALEGLPFRQDFFEPFIKDVERTRELPWVSVETFAPTPLAPILESRLFRANGDWIAVTRLFAVQAPERFSAWLDRHPRFAALHVNLRVAVSALVDGFRDAAMARLAWGGLVVALLIGIGLRSLSSVVQTLLPIGLGLLATVSALVIAGVQLHMFHLLALVLVAGLGLDYSLFLGRAAVATADFRQNLHGVLVGALTTLSTFGILALSDIPVLRALGATVAIGVVACLGFALLYSLPGPQSYTART